MQASRESQIFKISYHLSFFMDDLVSRSRHIIPGLLLDYTVLEQSYWLLIRKEYRFKHCNIDT